MTASAAKRRITHYVAATNDISHRDAEFAIQAMTPKEKAITGQKALKWRQDKAKEQSHE